jgi:hypothetical protein
MVTTTEVSWPIIAPPKAMHFYAALNWSIPNVRRIHGTVTLLKMRASGRWNTGYLK